MDAGILGDISGVKMRVILLAALVMLFCSAIPSIAGAGCPTRMDSLDNFAACMVPLRGTVGTAAVYSSGQYDEDHRELMQAMGTQAVIPPTVVPLSPYPYYSSTPYASTLSSISWSMTSAAAYMRGGGNPYFWFAFRPY